MKKTNILEKYTDQESILPKEIRKQLTSLGEGNIVLYAFADLNDLQMFSENWIVLTEKKLLKFTKESSKYVRDVEIALSKVVRVVEKQGLSCFNLCFIESDDKPPLLILNYTHRQKIGLGHIKYLIDNKKEENEELWNEVKQKKADVIYEESVLKPLLEAQNRGDGNKSSIAWRLTKYLLPYKKEMFLGMTGAVLTTAFSLLPPFLSGYLIDEVIKPFQDGVLNVEAAKKSAWLLLATLLVSKILRELFLYIRLNKMSIIGEKVAFDLREQLYSHLQTLGMDYFSKKQTGSLITRVSSDTDRIWDFIAFGIVEVSIALLTLLGLSCVLLAMDWKLALFMVVPVPLFLWAIYNHGQRMKKIFTRIFRKWAGLTAVLGDTIPGIQVVKAFSQEKKEIKRFAVNNKHFLDECVDLHDAWTKFWPILTLGIQLTAMGVWIYAIPRLLGQGDETLSAGTFVSFLLYMTMFSQPIEIIGQMARMLNRATSSAYRIFEILDTKPSIVENEDAKKIMVKGNVEYKNVFFSYDGVRPILKGINLKINAGEMIGLVGPSGGGKSTLTKLLARFYDSSSGEVIIDGESIKNLNIRKLRMQVGMVLQDPYLFHGTIMDNISYGMPNADLMEIIEAAKVANAHEFIGKFTSGYDTIIGERGHTLSGGERQRISIARAILHNPRILILDEATSAVDTETEHKIQEALDRLTEGRTVIAIAHRLSTLRKANRILVVDDGKIVEEGTHKELLKIENGTYRKLQNMQKVMHEQFAV
jgi:ATP-binding cassette subfamily B protein